MVDSPSSLPSGTVTFLMTDIEGSSLLYEQDELAARLTVARHNELLTAGIERRDGAVIRPRSELIGRQASHARGHGSGSPCAVRSVTRL